MEASSGSPSPTENSRDAPGSGSFSRQSDEHSSCATDSGRRFPSDTETDADRREDPDDCGDTAGAGCSDQAETDANQPEHPEYR